MHYGAITQYIDVAQLAFWAFFLGFIALILHLRREDRREGFPSYDPTARGQPIITEAPADYVYLRHDGTTTVAPHHDPEPPMRAKPSARFPGAPLDPIGNKLTAAVGPGTYTMRRDEPFLMNDGTNQVQPLRVAAGWSVMAGDADPRGMRVLDVRYLPVGVVTELWVDRGTKTLRYLEVALDAGQAPSAVEAGPLLMPIHFCHIDEAERTIRVTALHTGQFWTAPRPAHPDQITAREEDMVSSYYAGGRFHIDDDILGESP